MSFCCHCFHQNSKKSIAFSTFIRASIGMAYVPLNKLNHAHKILKQLGKELKGRKIKEFDKKFLYYYDKTWMNGHYKRHDWNMHMHRGISSNNISEGYNSKINNHKDLKANPNPYLLAAFIKDQFSGDPSSFSWRCGYPQHPQRICMQSICDGPIRINTRLAR